MKKSKFKIGDKVNNLQTGNKTSGTIVGVITGVFYLLRKQEKDIPYWSNFYKNWHQKCVYFVELDKPTPHCSIAEFVKHRPSHISEMEAVVQFNKIPLLNHMAYPEDDLRKV